MHRPSLFCLISISEQQKSVNLFLTIFCDFCAAGRQEKEKDAPILCVYFAKTSATLLHVPQVQKEVPLWTARIM